MPKAPKTNVKVKRNKTFVKIPQVGDKITDKFNRNKIIWVVLVVVIVVVGLACIYFYREYVKAQALLQNPTASANAQSKEVVVAVGKLIELPTNENPTIATVSDVTKLENQPFFAKAQNGDKVLVYAQSKMLILYRPSLNKIISVGTVNAVPVATTNPSPVLTPTPTVNPTVSPSPVSVPTLAPTPTPTATPVQ